RDTFAGVDARPAPDLRSRVDHRVAVHRRRVVAAIAGGVVAVAIVLGVGVSLATGSPTTKVDVGPAGTGAATTAVVTTTTAPSTTAAAVPPPSQVVTQTTAPGAAPCTSSQLTISLGQSQGAAGTIATPVVFTNPSHT